MLPQTPPRGIVDTIATAPISAPNARNKPRRNTAQKLMQTNLCHRKLEVRLLRGQRRLLRRPKGTANLEMAAQWEDAVDNLLRRVFSLTSAIRKHPDPKQASVHSTRHQAEEIALPDPTTLAASLVNQLPVEMAVSSLILGVMIPSSLHHSREVRSMTASVLAPAHPPLASARHHRRCSLRSSCVEIRQIPPVEVISDVVPSSSLPSPTWL